MARFVYHYFFFSNLIYSLVGHTGYGKFVIVSAGRSGSNMLTSLLNSHPNIHCYYEIFHDDVFQSAKNFYYPKSKKQHKFFFDDPQGYIHDVFYNRYHHKNISYVGFKIIYDQTRFLGKKSIWSYLESNSDIKIIHLLRGNLLAQYLSLVNAQKTRKYDQKNEREHIYEPVTLGLKECVKHFKVVEEYIAETELLFHHHDMINVYYEDLTTDRTLQLNKIIDFFGCPESSRIENSL